MLRVLPDHITLSSFLSEPGKNSRIHGQRDKDRSAWNSMKIMPLLATFRPVLKTKLKVIAGKFLVKIFTFYQEHVGLSIPRRKV